MQVHRSKARLPNRLSSEHLRIPCRLTVVLMKRNCYNSDMQKLENSVLTALHGLDVKTNVPLSQLTSFRIGGPATVVVRPQNESELCLALRTAQDFDLPWRILGRGSNVLAPDNGFEGMIVLLDRPFFPMRLEGNFLYCSAGEALSDVAAYSVQQRMTGMEGLEGIPGTVGGACAMNAGAYGAEMKQILRAVRVYRNGEIKNIDVQDEDLGHRRSAFAAPDTIVLSAVLELMPDPDGHALDRLQEFHRRREEKQPLSYPSAGSVFKRPVGHFAGGLIEQCGLKGLTFGGAQVSPKHAGFIVNIGGATARDVYALIDEIQCRVYSETGIDLERELKYWNEV